MTTEAEPRFRGEVSARVDARAADVFALITDINRLHRWNAAVEGLVDGPVELEVGSEWIVTMHVPKLPRWRSRSTVTHLDPEQRRFVYASTSDDRNPSYVDWFWEIADRGDHCVVTVRWHGYPLTFFRQRLGAPMRARQLTREVAASLAALTTAAVRVS